MSKEHSRRSILTSIISSSIGLIVASGLVLLPIQATAQPALKYGPKPPVVTVKYGVKPPKNPCLAAMCGPDTKCVVVKKKAKCIPVVTVKYGIKPPITAKYGVKPTTD